MNQTNNLLTYCFAPDEDDPWLANANFSSATEASIARNVVLQEIFGEYSSGDKIFHYPQSTNYFWNKRKRFRQLLKNIHYDEVVKHFVVKLKKERQLSIRDLVVYLKYNGFLEKVGVTKFKLMAQRIYHILRLRIITSKFKEHYEQLYKNKLIVTSISHISQDVFKSGEDGNTSIYLQGTNESITLDEYYNIPQTNEDLVFNISPIVPEEFDVIRWNDNGNIFKPIFSDSLIKRHNKKIRKYRERFLKNVVNVLYDYGFFPDLSKIIGDFCYQNPSEFKNLSKKHIVVENNFVDYDSDSDDSLSDA